MSALRVIAVCDWCEEEKQFESVEEFEAEWWIVLPPVEIGDDDLLIIREEQTYCSQACLAADMS